jgi:hypothetical protein
VGEMSEMEIMKKIQYLKIFKNILKYKHRKLYLKLFKNLKLF